MAGNAQPQFTRQGNISSVVLTAANTNSDGTGNLTTPTMYKAFASDPTNGSYVESARIMPVANAAATGYAATVIRLYVSTISSGATSSADTYLIAEIAVAAGTADQSTTAVTPIDVAFGFRLQANQFIHASSHVAANANTGYRVTVFGGDY